jgi:hypothetical protein
VRADVVGPIPLARAVHPSRSAGEQRSLRLLEVCTTSIAAGLRCAEDHLPHVIDTLPVAPGRPLVRARRDSRREKGKRTE